MAMQWMFFIAAIIAIAATARVITAMHPVHALLYLIVSLLAVALVFFTLGAPFAAALEVIIYAGAIMVLFVFVMMMLNLGEADAVRERSWISPGMWAGPALLAALLLIELVFLVTHGAGALCGRQSMRRRSARRSSGRTCSGSSSLRCCCSQDSSARTTWGGATRTKRIEAMEAMPMEYGLCVAAVLFALGLSNISCGPLVVGAARREIVERLHHAHGRDHRTAVPGRTRISTRPSFATKTVCTMPRPR